MRFFTPLGLAASGLLASVTFAADENWSVYLGDSEASHYSTLKEIKRKNLNRLEVAWTYTPSEVAEEGRTQIQCNPLAVDGVLYGTSAKKLLFA